MPANRRLSCLLLAMSAAFWLAGFAHLRADFPNGSPWRDWSKMTDEGWYGGAAIQHFVWGGWYLPESFNPAVAMPVWPAMLGGWFALTGVSMAAARALTMLLYGASLVLLYAVVRRACGSVAAALAVLLTAANPFCYAFDRLALLEPVFVFWTMLALWLAGRTGPRVLWRAVAVGVVLALLVLTKPTGTALVPAVLYMLWAQAGRLRTRRQGLLPMVLAAGVAAMAWLGFFVGCVRPHYLEDYRLLFSINSSSAHLSNLPLLLARGFHRGLWMGPVLYPAAIAVAVLACLWLHELWRMPLFGAAVTAMLCQMALIGYHGNFQPHYYLPLAMPMATVIVLGFSALMERLKRPAPHRPVVWALDLLGAAVAAATVLMAVQTVGYVLRPEYSFLTAAQGIADVVLADPRVRPVVLSDSGGDITLFTGLPGICDAYSLHGPAVLLERYRPGWYVAWPSPDGSAMEHIARLTRWYRMEEMARYQVFDDPLRQTLVLYKLSPLKP